MDASYRMQEQKTVEMPPKYIPNANYSIGIKRQIQQITRTKTIHTHTHTRQWSCDKQLFACNACIFVSLDTCILHIVFPLIHNAANQFALISDFSIVAYRRCAPIPNIPYPLAVQFSSEVTTIRMNGKNLFNKHISLSRQSFCRATITFRIEIIQINSDWQ